MAELMKLKFGGACGAELSVVWCEGLRGKLSGLILRGAWVSGSSVPSVPVGLPTVRLLSYPRASFVSGNISLVQMGNCKAQPARKS
jgi:hypothetical protein